MAASGPSLREAPDEWLTSLPVFSVNGAYRWYEERGLRRPDYLLTVDGRFPLTHRDAVANFGDDFLSVRYPKLVSQPDWKALRGLSLADTGGRLIADGSSTHAALHLALVAGCRPVYLIGADLSTGADGSVYASREEVPCQPPEVYPISWGHMHKGFEFIATLTRVGEVFDCSPWGRLTCFPKACPWRH